MTMSNVMTGRMTEHQVMQIYVMCYVTMSQAPCKYLAKLFNCHGTSLQCQVHVIIHPTDNLKQILEFSLFFCYSILIDLVDQNQWSMKIIMHTLQYSMQHPSQHLSQHVSNQFNKFSLLGLMPSKVIEFLTRMKSLIFNPQI